MFCYTELKPTDKAPRQRREGFGDGDFPVAGIVRFRTSDRKGPNSHEFGYTNRSQRCPPGLHLIPEAVHIRWQFPGKLPTGH